MYKRYKSDFPNQVHQLLVSVSQHYLIGKTNKIRYQKKPMDVSLKNFDKSDREHLVHFILRDHFSGFFHVEVASTKKMIPLQDFLLRGFLPKPDIKFCGIPVALMIPKQVEEFLPSVIDLLNSLGIQKINPPSGFASGIVAVKHWERIMKVPLLPDEGINSLELLNPRMTAYYCETYNSDNLSIWTDRIKKIYVPEENFARELGSSEFKFTREYPLYKPFWKD